MPDVAGRRRALARRWEPSADQSADGAQDSGSVLVPPKPRWAWTGPSKWAPGHCWDRDGNGPQAAAAAEAGLPVPEEASLPSRDEAMTGTRRSANTRRMQWANLPVARFRLLPVTIGPAASKPSRPALVAQGIEHRSPKAGVGSSNLPEGTSGIGRWPAAMRGCRDVAGGMGLDQKPCIPPAFRQACGVHRVPTRDSSASSLSGASSSDSASRCA